MAFSVKEMAFFNRILYVKVLYFFCSHNFILRVKVLYVFCNHNFCVLDIQMQTYFGTLYCTQIRLLIIPQHFVFLPLYICLWWTLYLECSLVPCLHVQILLTLKVSTIYSMFTLLSLPNPHGQMYSLLSMNFLKTFCNFLGIGHILSSVYRIERMHVKS